MAHALVASTDTRVLAEPVLRLAGSSHHEHFSQSYLHHAAGAQDCLVHGPACLAAAPPGSMPVVQPGSRMSPPERAHFQVSMKPSSAETMRPETLTSWLPVLLAVLGVFSTATVHCISPGGADLSCTLSDFQYVALALHVKQSCWQYQQCVGTECNALCMTAH